MAEMTNEYSKLPDEIYERHNFKDVDDSVGELITQIRTLQAAGDYAGASEIIEANKDTLEPYILSTEYINAIDEETRNLEIMVSGSLHLYYLSDSEPENILKGDIWIGGDVG